MLNYTSPIKELKKYTGLTVGEISPLMKLIFKQVLGNHFGKNV